MTAEEVREKAKDASLTKNRFDIDFDSIFEEIDYQIESEASDGNFNVFVYVDSCGESYECLVYKRKEIIEHYRELGYEIENCGYNAFSCGDTFEIKW